MLTALAVWGMLSATGVVDRLIIFCGAPPAGAWRIQFVRAAQN
jgi:hypothetical protein